MFATTPCSRACWGEPLPAKAPPSITTSFCMSWMIRAQRSGSSVNRSPRSASPSRAIGTLIHCDVESRSAHVNSTSIGLFPDTSRVPVDASTLRPELVVADIIPNPPRTAFLAEAEAAGCRTLDGLGMLVNQGRIGIEFWTGVDPDPAVMRDALEAIFGT